MVIKFLKVAVTQVDLFFIEQMYSQPFHLAHELIFCAQITRGWIDFNGDSTVISPEFQTCDFLTQIFDLPPYLPRRIRPFSWLHSVGPWKLSYLLLVANLVAAFGSFRG